MQLAGRVDERLFALLENKLIETYIFTFVLELAIFTVTQAQRNSQATPLHTTQSI